jgi:2'-5' RNA ligase
MKIRMFISIPVKDPSVLAPLLDEVGTIPNVKASPISQMHITMRFIGDIDDGKTRRVAGCVRDAVEGMEPFTITIKGAGCFPNPKRPSVVWIGAEPQDVLKGISDRISANLKASNVQFDEKPFKSHITIGRCKGPAEVDGFIGSHSGEEFESFQCDEVLVMRSELGPKGAKHTVLERIPLGQ